MGIADQAKSALSGAAAGLLALLRGLGAAVTFPVAVTFALVGQFALAGLLATVNPASDGAVGDVGAATALQILLFVLQGAGLVYSVVRAGAGGARLFLGLCALVWALGSMLLLYVVLQCGVGGVCL